MKVDLEVLCYDKCHISQIKCIKTQDRWLSYFGGVKGDFSAVKLLIMCQRNNQTC